MKGMERCAPLRRWLGLITVVLALVPWPGHADDQWTDRRRFGLLDSSSGVSAPSPAAEQVVAALSPGSSASGI